MRCPGPWLLALVVVALALHQPWPVAAQSGDPPAPAPEAPDDKSTKSERSNTRAAAPDQAKPSATPAQDRRVPVIDPQVERTRGAHTSDRASDHRAARARHSDEGRTTRRDVRVRASVTVIDPRTDVRDIISQIRRAERADPTPRGARRKPGAVRRQTRARHRDTPGRVHPEGRDRERREAERWEREHRRARRDARFERRVDTARRRSDRGMDRTRRRSPGH